MCIEIIELINADCSSSTHYPVFIQRIKLISADLYLIECKLSYMHSEIGNSFSYLKMMRTQQTTMIYTFHNLAF